VKVDPNDTRALLRLAELEAKGGNAVVACETYSRAGDIFKIQGFARRAISAFTQGLTVAREGALVDRVAPIARAMAKLYVGEKLEREAVATIDAAARWLIERGFDSNALPLLQARIEIEESDVARVRLAETLFRLGEATKAAGELVTVFMRLHAQGRRDEAIDVAERLLGERHDVDVARATAELYLSRNRPGDPFHAIAKLRICCEENSTHVPTLELLARAFDLAGHGEKATRVRSEIGFLTQGPRKGGSRAGAAPKQLSAGSVAKAAPKQRSEASVAKAAPKRRSDASVAKAAPKQRSEASVAKAAPKAPPRPTPRKKVRENSVAITVEIDEAWDDLLIEAKKTPDAAQRLDPSRQSFWAVEEGPTTEGSVCDVSLADMEIVGDADRESGQRPVSILETALECIESLIAQGRYDEALVMVGRYLANRPNNPLLLDRKAEIEEMQNCHKEGPPSALFGFTPPKKDSERSIPTRSVRVG
jgi:tetratricopeptide (TPR) repeat protein